MRNYELLFIVRPDLTDQDISTVRTEIKNYIASLNGTVEKEDIWGKRQLAFEIKDYTEGIYSVFFMRLPTEAPIKLRERLKIDERIIRFMITAQDRKPKVS